MTLHEGPGREDIRMDGKIQEHMPELLAPAGSINALEAAIAAGADAVYLSGKRYGARKYADNFTSEELAMAVLYAHRHGVRVYVTVNTLMYDHELPDVLRYLIELYKMGVDAVLVQDIGLASLCRDIIPDFPIHASTQCTIYSAEGVHWAKTAGFDRVVLARETSLEELDRIMAIDPKNSPGIEIFVHGALCYCYSGQCLMSSVIGGRSGNRGMCAQPCRKPYILVGAEGDGYGRSKIPKVVLLDDRFLLSTRDLMLYPFLEEVLKRPVAALKIEGRMRSPEYVGIVVLAYRKALQDLEKGIWTPSDEDMADMSIMFSRGFSGGYLMGDRGSELMGRERPDKRGLFLGKVISCDPDKRTLMIRPETKYVPRKGDGLAVADPVSGNITGFLLSVDGIPGRDRLIIPQGTECREGMEVYVTSSARLGKKVGRIIKTSEYAHNFPIPIDIALSFPEGGPPVLHGEIQGAGRQVEVVHTASFIPAQARTSPLTAAQIEEQMRKTGDSGFVVKSFDLSYSGNLFIPLGDLNKFRREFFEKVRKAFLQDWCPQVRNIEAAGRRFKELQPVLEKAPDGVGNHSSFSYPGISVYADSLDSVRGACEAGCRVVYFEPADRSSPDLAGELSDAISICREHGVVPVWKWPPVPGRDFLTGVFALISPLSARGLGGIMVENYGLAEAALEINAGMRLYGGQGLNIFNHRTVMALSPPFSLLTLSPELSGTQIRSLGMFLSGRQTDLEVIVQGNLLAMVSKDRLLESLLPVTDMAVDKTTSFGLKDKIGKIFPVDADSEGRTRIWNSVETCLVDHIPSLISAGIYSMAIDARGRSGDYARNMTEIYRESIDLTWDGLENGQYNRKATLQFDSLKKRARSISRGGITAGYYKKGLSV